MGLWKLTSPKICRVGKLETQEEPMFHFKSEGRKKSLSQLKGRKAGGILSHSRESQLFCSIQAFN